MHPALRADPFRAGLDVVMTTRDGHVDVAGIFQQENLLRYLVQVFHTASLGGKSPWPSISDGPELSNPQPQCAMSQWCPFQSINCPPPVL